MWGLTPFANCYSVFKDRFDLLIKMDFLESLFAWPLKPVILVLDKERGKSSRRRTLVRRGQLYFAATPYKAKSTVLKIGPVAQLV